MWGRGLRDIRNAATLALRIAANEARVCASSELLSRPSIPAFVAFHLAVGLVKSIVLSLYIGGQTVPGYCADDT